MVSVIIYLIVLVLDILFITYNFKQSVELEFGSDFSKLTKEQKNQLLKFYIPKWVSQNNMWLLFWLSFVPYVNLVVLPVIYLLNQKRTFFTMTNQIFQNAVKPIITKGE